MPQNVTISTSAYADGAVLTKAKLDTTFANTEVVIESVLNGSQSFDQMRLDEVVAPGTPAAGKVYLYAKADGLLYSKDDAGVESALGGSSTLPVVDTTGIAKGSVDATKILRFEVDGFTTATTRVLTPPNFDGTIATLAGTETFTNKTLTQFKLTTATTLTIATGAVTRTQGYHTIDTEAAAATDDLDTISGGAAGDRLTIVAANTARTVVIRHIGGGTGNIRTYNASSISLDETYKPVELIFDGTNWLVIGVIGGSATATKYAILRDEQTSGTQGGASVAATWNNRNLNTEVHDPDAIVSIASNQFTPIAGDYIIFARASVHGAVGLHRLRLYNVTGAASVDESMNNRIVTANEGGEGTLITKFTANGSDAYRIDHYTQSAVATNGLGPAMTLAVNEVYCEIYLEKVA